MTIGEKIKLLRQERGVTQERLAEYLNISYQSVSKWEMGKAMPDISLVVPLANFFEITTDELFDRGEDTHNKDIEEYSLRAHTLATEGRINEEVALWEEAVEKYPGDHFFLKSLASALWMTICAGRPCRGSADETAEEVIRIGERVLRDCTDSQIRSGTIQILVYTYGNGDLSVANEKKAVEYAMMADGFHTCREMLLPFAYYTEEGKKEALGIRHHNRLYFMDEICMGLHCESYPTVEERKAALETALKLWETLIPDKNYLFYHCRVSDLYFSLARCFADLGMKEETVDNLRLSLHHAKVFDAFPPGSHNYTSPFVFAASSCVNESTKNYTETLGELVLKQMKATCFDFVWDTPEFAALTE